MMSQTPLIQAENISKRFPGVQALDQVNLSVRPGQVHALVGENGAGKSTLIKILCGAYQADSGQIYFDGKPVEIKDPAVALSMGIVPVHQEINLQPYLTVAENIFIGRQPKRKLGLINYQEMNQQARAWMDQLGIEVDPTMPLGMISVAERQMVAIARAVSLDAQVLIFDEPTSSLTDRETELLFEVIGRLVEKNIGIIYITHRMGEIFEICDVLTVMRDGHVVGHDRIESVKTEDVIRMMIGRQLQETNLRSPGPLGETILEVEHLTVRGILNDISFKLHKGEIVGVSGLVGAGRTELARALFGDMRIASGSIRINGQPFNPTSPKKALEAGMGFVPEDRKEEGLVLELSVKKNVTMTIFSKIIDLLFLNNARQEEIARGYVEKLAIKTPTIHQKVQFLSGGNQQRVVVSKWLATDPKILIVDEPTRGIDVGAKAEIHTLLRDLANEGVAILMISSELPEILALSDRVLVMRQGRIAANLKGSTATQEEIMIHAADVAKNAHQAMEDGVMHG
jgi:ribose transport system ATP-binding protein